MTRKGNIILEPLFALVALFLIFEQAQAQLHPASSQTDFILLTSRTEGDGPRSSGW